MEIVCIKSKFLRNLFDQNTYVVKNANEAIIIDAGAEIEDVKAEIGESKVLGILMTHLHFDHFWNLDKYLDEFDCSVYICEGSEYKFLESSKNGAHVIRQDITRIIDKNRIKYYEPFLKLGNFNINVYFTKGHSSDCVNLLIESSLFSGDTLFENSFGRIDLFDSNKKQMIESLNIIKTINFDMIYPGHYGSSTKQKINEIIDKSIKFLNDQY